MNESESPNMVSEFLGLFRERTDEQIKSDFIALDVNGNGQIDLNEFIMILRVALYKKITNISDLIAHLDGYKREQFSKKKVKFYRIILDYKIVDVFTTGTHSENADFMVQFKSAIKFLDTEEPNSKVNLDEIIKAIRKIN